MEANVVVLRRGGRRIVFVGTDTLYFGGRLRAALVSALEGQVSEEDLFCCASHTHYAPGVDERLTALGPVNEDYVRFVEENIIGLARELLAEEGREAVLVYGESAADCSINRRARRWTRDGRRMAMAPNPDGPKDETVRVVSVMSGDEPLAVLWNYACHPVCYPQRDHVTSEFPGVVRETMRKRWGDGLSVVFMQGFAGNVRPKILDNCPKLRSRLHRAIQGPSFGACDVPGWRKWADCLAGAVMEALGNAKRELNAPLEAKRVTIPLSDLMDGRTEGFSVTFHRVALDGGLSVVGISAEPCAEYAGVLAGALDGAGMIPVGYIDSVFGYLPSSDLLPEGGYEVDGFAEPFGIEAKFRADVSERVSEAVSRLVG